MRKRMFMKNSRQGITGDKKQHGADDDISKTGNCRGKMYYTFKNIKVNEQIEG